MECICSRTTFRHGPSAAGAKLGDIAGQRRERSQTVSLLARKQGLRSERWHTSSHLKLGLFLVSIPPTASSPMFAAHSL